MSPEMTKPTRLTAHGRITKGVPPSSADTMSTNIIPRGYNDYPEGSLDRTTPTLVTSTADRIEQLSHEKKLNNNPTVHQVLSRMIRILAQSIPPRKK